MNTTDEALGVFMDGEDLAHEHLTSGGKAAGLWGRFTQKARQLAIIDACSRCDRPDDRVTIDEESANWGCRLAKLLTENMAVIATDWLSANQVESQVQQVLRLIKAEPGISQNQLTRRTQWLRSSERHEIIETLVNSDQVTWEYRETGKKKSTVYYPAKASNKTSKNGGKPPG